MVVRHFRELTVWQRAMELAEQCYRHTRAFPKEEGFGLTVQIRRAGCSIMAECSWDSAGLW